MQEILSLTNRLMELIDEYEVTKASHMAFTKVEEAILWMQVMVSQTKKKAAMTELKTD